MKLSVHWSVYIAILRYVVKAAAERIRIQVQDVENRFLQTPGQLLLDHWARPRTCWRWYILKVSLGTSRDNPEKAWICGLKKCRQTCWHCNPHQENMQENEWMDKRASEWTNRLSNYKKSKIMPDVIFFQSNLARAVRGSTCSFLRSLRSAEMLY